MDDMDWKAAMDSEVFREYARNEIVKIQKKADVVDDGQILEDFSKFEAEVRASPVKLRAFKALQNKFATDPEYTAKVKKSFVEAVMLLNLK